MAATAEQMAEALTHMMSQQQALNDMIANLVKLHTANAANTTVTTGFGKQWYDLVVYRNIKTFSGDQKDWEEFHGKMKGQIAAKNGIAAEVLDFVEAKMSEAELNSDVFKVMVAGQEMDDDDLREVRNRMFNVLLNLTTGEANAVVRRCQGRCGLLAWKKLCTTLNPRTLASGVKLISQVINPAKIVDARKADVAIEMWDDKLVKLSTEYGEKLSDKLKVAVLYGMLPKDLQERALDKCAINWDQTKEGDATLILTKIKEEVKNVAKSRRDMVTPRPMEVDNIQAEWYGWGPSQDWHEEQAPSEEGQEGTEFDINYVGKGAKGKGKGKCWTCGETGHRAAECPKGKGKASTWQGKNGGGWYKGGYKGDGKGGKGEGKAGKGGWTNPMPRACFGCGSTAHMLRDCPNNKTAHDIHEVSGDEPEVLFIGQTVVQDRQAAWTEVTTRRTPQPRVLGDFIRKPPGLSWKPHLRAKGFKVLEVDEPDEDEAKELNIRCIECEPQAQWRARLDAQENATYKSPSAEKGNLQKFKRRKTHLTKVQAPKNAEDEDKKRKIVTIKGHEDMDKVIKEYKVQAREKTTQEQGADEVMEIRTVDGKPKPKEKKWASLGVGDIVVDSAADESCWPKDLGGAFETKPSTKNIVLRTANGGEMGHYGEKEITIRSGESEDVIGLRFQVTDVKKPLLAVRRLVERGSVVSFGPEPSDNYIQNVETGKKISMEKRGGSFVIKAHFVKEISSVTGAESGFTRQAQ
jgi:hypothetical protein